MLGKSHAGLSTLTKHDVIPSKRKTLVQRFDCLFPHTVSIRGKANKTRDILRVSVYLFKHGHVF